MKQAAEDANKAGYPVNIMTGTVTKVKPLTVTVEQRFTITGAYLIVPEYLTDHEVSISFDGRTEPSGEPQHRHGYGGKLVITVQNGLKAGDNIVLLRQQGGQKYLIVDRVAEI